MDQEKKWTISYGKSRPRTGYQLVIYHYHCITISKRKIMEAMLMNEKEKHEVFDWSDIVSMSQSEFVLFCATNCELPPLKQMLFVCFLNRINAFVTSVSFFCSFVPFLWKSK